MFGSESLLRSSQRTIGVSKYSLELVDNFVKFAEYSRSDWEKHSLTSSAEALWGIYTAWRITNVQPLIFSWLDLSLCSLWSFVGFYKLHTFLLQKLVAAAFGDGRALQHKRIELLLAVSSKTLSIRVLALSIRHQIIGIFEYTVMFNNFSMSH